jgi:iron(III) transport system substrate-binding protein
MRINRLMLILLAVVVLTAVAPLSAQDSGETLTVYSGRSEGLIGPILEQFTAETGVRVEVRYGSTAEMAATILEEGDNSPADVYIAQDAGALGALAAAGRLAPLPSDVLERVPAAYQSQDGLWVGVSGRARAIVYNTELISEAELPASLLDLAQPEWAGRVGWAPANGSLQSQVTAMRVLLGEDAARAWVQGMVDNGSPAFDNNDATVQAVIDGEFPVGIVNHYYIFEFLEQNPDAPIAVHFFQDGDIGNLINVAGAGVVASSDQPGLAQRLILFLLGGTAQTYFAHTTGEYPLIEGVALAEGVLPLDSFVAPDIDLNTLNDLETTLTLLRDTGALP